MTRKEFELMYSNETVLITDRNRHSAPAYMAMAVARLAFSTVFHGVTPRLYINSHPEQYVETSGCRAGCSSVEGSFIIVTRETYANQIEEFCGDIGMFLGMWHDFGLVITDGDQLLADAVEEKVINFLKENKNLDLLFNTFDITWAEASSAMTTSGTKGMTHWGKYLVSRGITMAVDILNRFLEFSKSQIELAATVNIAVDRAVETENNWVDDKGDVIVAVIDSVYRLYNVEDVIYEAGGMLRSMDKVAAIIFHDPSPQPGKNYYVMITDKYKNRCSITTEIADNRLLSYHRRSYDPESNGYTKFTSSTFAAAMSGLRDRFTETQPETAEFVYNISDQVNDLTTSEPDRGKVSLGTALFNVMAGRGIRR